MTRVPGSPARSNRRVQQSRLATLLHRRLSPERLGPYLTMTNMDLTAAIKLYEWNIAVSGALLEELCALEVVLRNAMHEQLARWHDAAGRPGSWYDDPDHLLERRAGGDIAEARRRVRRRGRSESPGQVVAELSFGFWRYLLDRRYQNTLWAQALRRAFPYLKPARRQDAYDPVERLHGLRNRVVHHEPVFILPLEQRHEEICNVAGFIDPQIRQWIIGLGRVPILLKTRPLVVEPS